MLTEAAVYEHDCHWCVFIGHYAGYDLYRCSQSGKPTIVARYGNGGPDYRSGPSQVVYDIEVRALS
jgi:hypothetical protein